jgi:hypothetical protein
MEAEAFKSQCPVLQAVFPCYNHQGSGFQLKATRLEQADSIFSQCTDLVESTIRFWEYSRIQSRLCPHRLSYLARQTSFFVYFLGCFCLFVFEAGFC